jgi:hypothetical protein
MAEYVLVKFAHILIAIVALGTSAGLGIVLELYGNHPVHGTFVLRAIERMTGFLVLPGYALMLATGLCRWDRHRNRTGVSRCSAGFLAGPRGLSWS